MPETEPPPEPTPIGSRLLRALLEGHRTILGLALVSGLGGWLLGALPPRPFVDRAVVEIGVRLLNHPLEHPMIAAARLEGEARAASLVVGGGAEVSVHNRREEKTNALTRFMDLEVRAETAEAARGVLDRSLEALLERHAAAHDHEIALFEEQRVLLQRADALVTGALVAAKAEIEDPRAKPEARSAHQLRLERLTGRVYESHRLLNGTHNMLTPLRTPPTRVISRSAVPVQRRSRAPIQGFAGLLFGLCLGCALAGARLLAREARDGEGDPALLQALRLLAAHRWWVAGGALAFGIAGMALASLGPNPHVARQLLMPAKVMGEGPVLNLETVVDQLGSQLAAARVAGQVPEDVHFTLEVVRDQPPTAARVPLLQMTAEGPDPTALRAVGALALDRLRALEDPTLELERVRAAGQEKTLRADLARLEEVGMSAEGHELLVKAILELAEVRRQLSPVRTHGAEILVAPHPTAQRGRRQAVTFGLIGLLAGALVGFGAGVVTDAARLMRQTRPAR